MPSSSTQPESHRKKTVSAIRQELAEAPAGASLWIERRIDRRVSIVAGSPPDESVTTTRGAALSVGENGEDERYHPLEGEDGLLDGVEPAPAAGPLARCVERATSSLPAGSVVGGWTAWFEQRIALIRPGAEPRIDRRRSAWTKIRAFWGNSEVQLDWVGGPDNPGIRLERLGERLEARREAAVARPGETAVVFAAGAGGVLIHELVGHALEADVVLEGRSCLGPGDLPAGTEVAVTDDPARGRAAYRLDDEGTPARSVPLIVGGEVRELLHDRRTAAAIRAEPNGRGRRASYREPVVPRMSCTFLEPRSLDSEEVVADTLAGIYVRRMDVATVDPCAGVAWFHVRDGDRIDHGRLDEPLMPFLLRVETKQALPSLDRVASDLAFDTCIGSCLRAGQPMTTSVGAPTFRIGVATVAS